MFLKYLRVKLHRAVITDADLNYEGSLTIPADILDKSGLKPFETIDVYNINNGKRFTTYVIKGDKKGVFCANGAAARLVMPGDRVIVASFQYVQPGESGKYSVRILRFDESNNIINSEEYALSNEK